MFDTVMDDDTLVVRAAQQTMQAVHGQRPRRGVRSRPGRQATRSQLSGQAGDAPLAGGVGVERPDDVLGPFRVDRDGADFTAIVESTLVEIPEWRPPRRSSLDGLLSHPFHHLGNEVLGVELRDGRHDPMQQPPARCGADRLGRRD